MHININNLTINVYVNGETSEPPYDPSWDEDFPEDAAAAEEVLFEAQDEKVAPVEDYWDKTVDAAVKPTTFEPKSLVKVNAGYYDDRLAGKVGRVVRTNDHDYILVQFDGWTKGHDGNLSDGTKSRWFFSPEKLTPYTLKVGDTVRHMGDGTGEEFQDSPYGGYEGQSLVGKTGTVIKDEYEYKEGEVLIDWNDWQDGHNQPISCDTGSRWWTNIDNLNKVEQWNS